MYLNIIIIAFILFFYFRNYSENFNNFLFNYPSRSLCPTRNMSYDLRCEPKIPVDEYAFLNASVIPHPDCDKIPKKCLN